MFFILNKSIKLRFKSLMYIILMSLLVGCAWGEDSTPTPTVEIAAAGPSQATASQVTVQVETASPAPIVTPANPSTAAPIVTPANPSTAAPIVTPANPLTTVPSEPPIAASIVTPTNPPPQQVVSAPPEEVDDTTSTSAEVDDTPSTPTNTPSHTPSHTPTNSPTATPTSFLQPRGRAPDGIADVLDWGGIDDNPPASCEKRSNAAILVKYFDGEQTIGTEVLLCFVGFASNQEITVQLNWPNGIVEQKVIRTNDDGVAALRHYPLLGHPLGSYQVVGRQGAIERSKSFDVEAVNPELPSIRVWPKEGLAGETFYLTVIGYKPPNENLSLHLYRKNEGDGMGHYVNRITIKTDANGNALYSFKTYLSDPPGLYRFFHNATPYPSFKVLPLPTAAPSPSITPTITETPTITHTSTITETPTITDIATVTSTPTINNIPTITETLTISNTPTIAQMPTINNSESLTQTTSTLTPSPEAITPSPVITPTVPDTPTVSTTTPDTPTEPLISPVVSPTATETNAPTNTPTPLPFVEATPTMS